MTDTSDFARPTLERQLQAAYGSLLAPRYDFLKNNELRKSHAVIKTQLEAGGLHIEDDTDENTDVCTYLVVDSDTACLLSLVAPYAVVTQNMGRHTLTEADVAALTWGERFLAILQDHNLRLLPPDLLTQKVSLNRVEDDQLQSTVMEAFFYAA